jgi:Flp pilus assembly protein TadD
VSRIRLPTIFLVIPIVLALLGGGCGKESVPEPRQSEKIVDASARQKSAKLLRRGRRFLADFQNEQAIRTFEEARSLDPASTPVVLALGRAYLQDTQFAAARRTIEEVIASSSARPEYKIEGRQILVEIFLALGDLPAARQACTPLLQSKPVSSTSHRLAGVIAYREGDLERAQAELAEALRLDPSDPETLSDHGLVFLQAGKLDEARRVLEQAVRLDPHSHTALNNLAKTYQRLGREEDAERTRARFREVYDRKSVRQKVGPLRSQGVEHFNDGRFGEALESFQRILEMSPRDAQAMSQVGSVLLAMRRLAEAESYLRRALEVNPDSDFALTELGRVRALQEDLPGAIEMFERAIEVNPNAPEPHYFLAGIYFSQNRQEDYLRERSAFERIMKDSPDASVMIFTGEDRP